MVPLGSVASQRAVEDPPVLENEHARLVFDALGGLDSLDDKTLGHNHRDASPPGELWKLLLGNGRQMGPEQAGTVSFALSDDGKRADVRWVDFRERPSTGPVGDGPDQPGAGRAREPVADLGARSGGTDGPVGTLPASDGSRVQDREVLAVPAWMGEQTRRARQLLNPKSGTASRREWAYPGLLSLQCLALFQEQGPGLLLSTDDTAALA